MDDDIPADRRSRDLLTDLGFTEYEATCLVAVLQRPGASATDIAASSELPRSRVYDVADSLADRGFLQVAEGEPKRYRAIPPDQIRRTLQDRYESSLDALGSALDDVEQVEAAQPGDCSVWSFTGRRNALSRSWDAIENADDRVWLLVRGGLLSQDCVDVLQSAVDRGVSLTVATDDGDLREWLHRELPDATFIDAPPMLYEDTEFGMLARLLLVDRDTVLTATRHQETPASPPEFAGCMATGRESGFVLTHFRLLADWLTDGESA